MSPLSKASRFVETIWAIQNPDADWRDTWGFVSTKNWDTGEWHDHPVQSGHLPVLGDADLYFAPGLFGDERRLRRHAVAGRWLYADLDEVDPAELELHPTVAWQTSPGRYQALWLLDRHVAPRTLERLNQRLTYHTGADKGGWSLTKVLRVPGSISTKYGEPYEVKLLWSERTVYRVEEISALLRDVQTTEAPQDDRPLAADLPDADEVYTQTRRRMTPRARQLLNTKNILASDDRSAKLWVLENELINCGLSLPEVLVLVRESPWNKYRGQRRELDMLWKEISKAAANRAKPAAQKIARKRRRVARQAKTGLAVTSYHDLMTKSLPRTSWMVEGIWSENAHGMMGGESKSFKTLLCLDLLVSVASGTPFLDRFNVPRIGPVLFIQEENQQVDIQDRLMRITSSRGIGPQMHRNGDNPDHAELDFGQKLPIDIMSNQGFSFTDEDSMHDLERYLKAVRPVLVIFDPLYLIAKGIDENSAAEMTPILSNLLRLKQQYDTGIMIVHHYSKGGKGNERSHRSADRMSGTGVFHRWLASGVYVERPDETMPTVRLSSEHRTQANPGAFSVTFDLGTEEDLHYAVEVGPWRTQEEKRADSLMDVILAATSKYVSITTLAKELKLTEGAVRARLKRRNIPVIEHKGNMYVPAHKFRED